MQLTDEARRIKESVFYRHPLSALIDIRYAPEYQEKWMDERLYGMVLDEEWARLRTLRRRKGDGNKVIVHIKAQHMLYSDGYPGPEYENRLAEALELGKRFAKFGTEVIYVTSGAIHAGCDNVTLAEAGKSWLVNHGVDPADVVMHTTLKNGNDEDYQVAAMMDADKSICELHVVCSTGQVPRMQLCFISNGWLPDVHPITYLGTDQDDLGEEPSAQALDALRPHQSLVAELRGKGFGISPFFESSDAIRAAEQAATQRHEKELENFSSK